MSTRGWPNALRRQHLEVVELRGERGRAERAHDALVREYLAAGLLADPDERRRTQARLTPQLREAHRQRQLAVHRFLAANMRLTELLHAHPA